MALLQAGDFERGWPEYEWRLKTGEITHSCVPAASVGRQPASMAARFLLYADFGLGDSIQFIRYASLVADRGGHVVVACPEPLARLFASCRGVGRVVVEGCATAGFRRVCPDQESAGHLRDQARDHSRERPLFRRGPGSVEKWHDELSSLDGFKVGIAWQGNPRHMRDRHRSFRLEQLEPLARVAGVRLVSCQKGFGSEQIAGVADRFSRDRSR